MDGSILNNGYTWAQQVEQGKGGGGGCVTSTVAEESSGKCPNIENKEKFEYTLHESLRWIWEKDIVFVSLVVLVLFYRENGANWMVSVNTFKIVIILFLLYATYFCLWVIFQSLFPILELLLWKV